MKKGTPMNVTRTTALLALCLSGLLALAGCQSSQTTAEKPAPAPAPAAKPAPAPAPKPVAAGMVKSAVALPTGDRATSGLLIEKVAPASVTLNKSFDYTITVTNLTDVDLSNVQIMDMPPSTFKLSSADPRADVSEGKLTWSLGNMPARSSKTITISGSASAIGTLTNCATGSYDIVVCVATQVVQPAIEITKTITPNVMLCDPIDYKVVVTNPGTGPATNVVVVDDLPAGLETASGSKQVKFDVGTLAAGQSRELIAKLKATTTGKFESPATVTADAGLTAKADAAVSVMAPKLAITKTAPERTFLGQAITYNINVKNTGNGDANNTIVTETLPAGATFVSASDAGTSSAGSVVWKIGTLKAGAEKNFTVSLRADTKGTLKNTASADADCADAVSAAASTNVEGIPAILLEVIDQADPVAVGDSTTYLVTVTNQGSAVGTNIKIVCNLEQQAEFVSGTGDTAVTARGKTITMAPVASLAPKAQASWKVVVKAVGEGDVRFAVQMTSDQITRSVDETEATNFYK